MEVNFLKKLPQLVALQILQSSYINHGVFQDDSNQTRKFTHKMTILDQFVKWSINFLAWWQIIINLECFANNVIYPVVPRDTKILADPDFGKLRQYAADG